MFQQLRRGKFLAKYLSIIKTIVYLNSLKLRITYFSEVRLGSRNEKEMKCSQLGRGEFF